MSGDHTETDLYVDLHPAHIASQWYDPARAAADEAILVRLWSMCEPRGLAAWLTETGPIKMDGEWYGVRPSGRIYRVTDGLTNTPTMAVVGLDVSLRSTGWARLAYEDGQLLDCGLITTTTADDEPRCLEILADGLTDVLRVNDDVSIEGGIAAKNSKVTMQLARAWGVAVLTARRRCGISPQVVGIGTAKKLATHNGKANKQAMINAAVDRWGDRAAQSDMADACWIAEVCRLHLHRWVDEQGTL